MNNDEYLSMREIGTIIGKTSHAIGKELIRIGLRTADKRPSGKAFREDFVKTAPSTNEGTYLYIWNKEKTIAELKKNGFC